MATNSIYNNIKVTDKAFCRSLINALERSHETQSKQVTYSKKVSELDKSQIEKIFGEDK